MKRSLLPLAILCLLSALLAGCGTRETPAEAPLTLAIGNADVPVGDYTLKIFNYYGIDEAAIASRLTYGSNVKEVLTAVTEGTVGCGIVYQTDACSAGLTPVDFATAEMCGQVVYPAALLKDAPNAEASAHFLAYLRSADAGDIFTDVGFTPLSPADFPLDVSGDSGEIVVFAAASLKETLTKIGEDYKAVAPNVDLTFTFDSSGTLKTQIEEGAVCDLFVSAAQKQMDALNDAGLIAADTRLDLLENKVCLCVASNSACAVGSFDDLAARLKT